jgi:uncharacterized protein (TIGR02266 family)
VSPERRLVIREETLVASEGGGGPALRPDWRAVPRYRVSVRVEYESDGESRRANVYDLGTDGVFICTSEPLAPGSKLDLTIHTPGDQGFVYADGHVVWVNLVETETVPAGMGVRFVRIDPEARERLERQLESLG